MNKILTVSIAAYNVEEYIENTLKSLLIDNIEDLEILVEDDGGTDNTADIVKEYEKKYPGIVKLIHKENGGYGSTINKSIELAQGKFFKQLDGDDWVDKDNFRKFLDILRKVDVDVVYTPYIEFFENKNQTNKRDFFEEEVYGEVDIDEALEKTKRYLSMYTLTYKTEILKNNNIKLIEKCFYTDTEYALYPIIYCKNIYITHIYLYTYRIGRKDQSISLNGKTKHYKDHIKVSKRLLEFWNMENNKLSMSQKKYIKDYITLMVATSIGDILILLPSNEQNLVKIKNFDKHVLNNNKEIYDEIEKKSKIVKLLRKSNYKLYKLLAFCKRRKYK